MAIKVCSRCSSPLEPKTLESLSVEESPLTLKVRGLPVLQCTKGHKTPVHRDFMVWMIQALREREGTIPAAEEKGMVFKKHFCACGKELPGKPAARRSFGFDLEYQGTAPFRAELDLPAYKCPGCGKEQIPSQKALHGAIAPAMASLNDTAGFPHSG